MRILVYVEPVVYRSNPLFLAPHVQGWAGCFLQSCQGFTFSWALASSGPLCDLARQQHPQLRCFPIPSWSILASCAYQRDHYSIALFDPEAAEQGISGEGPLAALAAELQAINRAFQPDAVLATSENALLPLAFPQARCLWMEQAPLPRQKRRARVYIDPCGHQRGSVIEQATDRILALDLPAAHGPEMEALWQGMQAPASAQRSTATAVDQAIRQCAKGKRVALFVLQPPDWLAWEGALGAAIAPEAVLAQWAQALPSGWVGIPLYKPDARLSESLEASLAEAFPRLVPLPPELSGNVAEWALPVADAVVTVSSSMAGQALISGKQVVVLGRSPMQRLAATSISALADPGPSLSIAQRLALLAFLSHRYTLILNEIADPAGPFPAHLHTLVTSPDPINWLLDLSGWSPARLARLV